MRRNFFKLIIITALTTFTLTLAWEFLFEDSIIGDGLSTESPLEHISDAITSLILVIIGLLVSFVILAKSETKQRLSESSLKGSDENLKRLFYDNPDAVLAVDNKGKFIAVNEATIRLGGYSEKELLEMNFFDLMSKRFLPKAILDFAKVIEGLPQRAESAFHRKGGIKVAVEITAIPIFVDNHLEGAYAIVKDISDRIRNQEALSESEESYKALFQNNLDAIFSLDPIGKFISTNPAGTKISGYRVEELRRMDSFRDIIVPEEIEKNAGYFIGAMTGTPSHYETTILHKNGRRIDIEITGVPIYIKGRTIGIHGIAKDITERKQAEIALKEFSRKLVESQEAESKRIATELHDGLGQNLLAISRGIKQYLNSIESKGSSVDELTKISSLALESVDEVSEISYNLHPHILDQLGLKSAVESIFTRMKQSTDIKLSFDVYKIDGLLSKNLEINIYRIIQEGLTNIIKHSSATHAEFKVSRNKKSITICINDNGKGFEITEADLPTKQSGIGLRTIRERVKLIEGTLHVDSASNKGTTLKIEIPIKDTE